MSLLEQSEWSTIKDYLRIQVYDRDGGHLHPRIRIELTDSAPPDIKTLALAAVMPCVHCGLTVNPFRARTTDGGIYFAATCRLEDCLGCARSKDARNEYLAIREALGY